MGENKKVFFIINKYSGTGYRPAVEGRILAACEKLDLECTIEFTRERGHATELAREAAGKNMDAVFAVGGDGTVNETARALVHTGMPMGILPKGSGNGLARHLGIPMSLRKSLDLISSNKIIAMDTLLVNGNLAVNVAGIGFDGHIAGLFGADGKRGLIGYGMLVLQEFLRYKEFEAEVVIGEKSRRRNAFIIAFANSSQFGNNARIAPQASVSDHLAEVCFIRKVPLSQIAGFVHKMFTGKLDRSAFVEIEQSRNVKLQFADPIAFHIDGEAMVPAGQFTMEVQPASLKMIVPEQSKKKL